MKILIIHIRELIILIILIRFRKFMLTCFFL